MAVLERALADQCTGCAAEISCVVGLFCAALFRTSSESIRVQKSSDEIIRTCVPSDDFVLVLLCCIVLNSLDRWDPVVFPTSVCHEDADLCSFVSYLVGSLCLAITNVESAPLLWDLRFPPISCSSNDSVWTDQLLSA